MKHTSRLALIVSASLVAASALATPAAAAESDMSVVYSTQNITDAPQDGSYTVYSRPGWTRDDMQLVWTIQNQVPVASLSPVLEVSGSLSASTGSAEYEMQFGCDSSLTDCDVWTPMVTQLNTFASSAGTADFADFAANFAVVRALWIDYAATTGLPDYVPVGITLTITTSVMSEVAGASTLTFYTEDAQNPGEVLSPTVTTPFVVIEPELTLPSLTSFCAVSLENTETQTATGYGQSDFTAADVQVTDDGYYDDDVTPVGTDGGFDVFLSNADLEPLGFYALGDADAALLALEPGTYALDYGYTAPDGFWVIDGPVFFEVLGADAAECYTDIEEPTEETGSGSTDDTSTDGAEELAATGADSGTTAAAALLMVVMGGALLRMRRFV